jgi:polyhydroxybutyrate depolymerase
MAALVVGGVGSGSAAAAGSGCSLTSTGGTVTRTLGDRTYGLNVPAGLEGSVPLLLSLHGAGSAGWQDEYFTGWSAFAAKKGFIVAYPQARPSSQSGLWDPYTPASTDVAYLKSVVADVSASYCVNPSRVHVDGWSNGAVMSQRTACDAADVFASASSYAGGTPTAAGFGTPCAPSRPIAMALFAGQYDFTYATLASNASDWRTLDGCGAGVHSTDAYGSTVTYSCAAGTHVVARVVNLTSHNWPSGAQGEDQRERLWAFFTANPRP